MEIRKESPLRPLLERRSIISRGRLVERGISPDVFFHHETFPPFEGLGSVHVRAATRWRERWKSENTEVSRISLGARSVRRFHCLSRDARFFLRFESRRAYPFPLIIVDQPTDPPFSTRGEIKSWKSSWTD